MGLIKWHFGVEGEGGREGKGDGARGKENEEIGVTNLSTPSRNLHMLV